MKKKLLIVAAFVAVGLVAVSVMSKPAPKTKDQELKVFLSEAGFKNIPSMKSYSVDAEKKFWMDKHGLYFVSHAEMDSLCRLNGFIVGPSERFQEEIPQTAIVEMKNNYDEVGWDMIKYGFKRWLSADQYMMFTSNEMGWVVRTFKERRSYYYDWVRENLKYRLNKSGVEIMNTVYNTSGLDDWEMEVAHGWDKILIVADPRKFNTDGMVINGIHLQEIPKPDPIAVIRHRMGYVILAKW